ncbi:hypothetical protein DYI37_17290 [Fulvimarina endophytica]|uniref:Zorya protein ZorC EH domain-containing protein n=1 Tax=Fulvimarina endophytica TaxID=2293836 RepID=A0A371WZ47_9HYPH|nr:EH signature domain-containing protein [Fulvimarina endophytica]RFC62258.1 hypothetical protein DYI37_17290 [Fulvimarina endophytica]
MADGEESDRQDTDKDGGDGSDEHHADDRQIGLREAIGDLLARHRHAPASSPPSELTRTVALLDGVEAYVSESPKKDYDVIASQIASCLAARDRIAQRNLRDGAWCMWKTKPALAEDAPILSEFLRRCQAENDKRIARNLLSAYLTQWQDDRPGLNEISVACTSLAGVAGHQYSEAQCRYRLFSLPSGPVELGRAAVQQRRAPPTLLAELGFSDSIARGGFSLPCTRAALETAGETKELSPRERLDLVRDLALLPDGTLINQTLSVPFANALLMPYSAKSPTEDIKQETINLVTRVLGDPRTNSWIGMDQARRVLLRWLTRLALSQFLDVVEAVNPDPNWKYRRRFWEAMNEEEAILGAWAVLSSEGEAEARRRFGLDTPFATFHRGYVQSGHAVLLMQIGPGICAEWSFSGKCRFWADSSRQGAPKMYEKSYDADFLRKGRSYAPVLEVVHSPHRDSRSGVETAWQHKVYRRISGMTGIRVPSDRYM